MIKKGQRYLRTYKDNGSPSLIIEVLEDSFGPSAQGKIVQEIHFDSIGKYTDWQRYKTWAFELNNYDVNYLYLEGQDFPQFT